MSYIIRKNKSIQLFVVLVLVFLTILKRSHCYSIYNNDLNEKMSSEELVYYYKSIIITVIFIVLFIFILILE